MKIKKFLAQRALPIGLSFSSLFFAGGCNRQSVSQNDEVGIAIESNIDDTMEEEIHSLEVGQKYERKNAEEKVYQVDNIMVLNYRDFESNEEHNYLVNFLTMEIYEDFITAHQLGISLDDKEDALFLYQVNMDSYEFVLNKNNKFQTTWITYSNEQLKMAGFQLLQYIRIDNYDYVQSNFSNYNMDLANQNYRYIYDNVQNQMILFDRESDNKIFEVSLSFLKDLYSFEDKTITLDTLTKIEKELNENNKLTRNK